MTTNIIWNAIETRETIYDLLAIEEKIKSDPDSILANIAIEVKAIADKVFGGYLKAIANPRVSTKVNIDKIILNENNVENLSFFWLVRYTNPYEVVPKSSSGDKRPIWVHAKV